MLLNNGNEYPHGCWVCRNKLGQLSLQPCKHNMGLHLVSRSTRQAQTVWLSVQTSTQQLGFLSKAYSAYLNLLGQQNGAGTLLSTGICLTLLALPALWGWSRNHPSLLTSPIVRVAGGCKCGDAQHAGWKRKAFKALEAEFAGKPGSQEPHSALYHPPMVLKSLKRIFYFFLVFLTLRRLSHKQLVLQWEVWGPNGASLQHLRGASHCVQTTLLEASSTRAWAELVQLGCGTWSSLTSSTLALLGAGTAALAPGHPLQQGEAVGSHQDPQRKLHSGVSLCSGELWWAGKASHSRDGACPEQHRRSTALEWAGDLTGENETACNRRRWPLQHKLSLKITASCARPDGNKESYSTPMDSPGSA